MGYTLGNSVVGGYTHPCHIGATAEDGMDQGDLFIISPGHFLFWC